MWQENYASGGAPEAQDLLASGDLDPAWNAPIALTSEAAARVALGADVVLPGTRDLPDGMYFARASDGIRVLNARVVVTR